MPPKSKSTGDEESSSDEEPIRVLHRRRTRLSDVREQDANDNRLSSTSRIGSSPSAGATANRTTPNERQGDEAAEITAIVAARREHPETEPEDSDPEAPYTERNREGIRQVNDFVASLVVDDYESNDTRVYGAGERQADQNEELADEEAEHDDSKAQKKSKKKSKGKQATKRAKGRKS